MCPNLEACRLLFYQAETRLSEDHPAEREVVMAKAKASETIPALTQLAHQIPPIILGCGSGLTA